jgi:hypothetical protein
MGGSGCSRGRYTRTRRAQEADSKCHGGTETSVIEVGQIERLKPRAAQVVLPSNCEPVYVVVGVLFK